MPKYKFNAKKLARIEATTSVVNGTNKLLCLTTAVAFGLLICATAFPQKRELKNLEAKLRSTQEREQASLDIKVYREIQLKALRDDKAYLEVEARDRLNYHREGERVLRFEQ
jgi:hypothetical protein